jgi:hypothetical protein
MTADPRSHATLKVAGGVLVGLGSIPILLGAAAAYLLLPAWVSVLSVACLGTGGYLIVWTSRLPILPDQEKEARVALLKAKASRLRAEEEAIRAETTALQKVEAEKDRLDKVGS